MLSGREGIQFTVEGPTAVQSIDGSTTGCKTGCAIIDLKFQNPTQIGELVLSNYYTAWVAIYVKRSPAKSSLAATGPGKGASAGATNRVRPQFERSISVDLSGSDFRSKIGSNDTNNTNTGAHSSSGDLFALETLHSTNPNVNYRRRHSSGPNAGEVAERPWECCIPMKTLMPFPHFEAGCQDVFSIPATENLIEMKDVVILRIILYQPSTVWKIFTVKDIQVFRNLPKRGCAHADDSYRQREGWLATLRLNTKKMLSGQLVEPEKCESDEDGDP